MSSAELNDNSNPLEDSESDLSKPIEGASVNSILSDIQNKNGHYIVEKEEGIDWIKLMMQNSGMALENIKQDRRLGIPNKYDWILDLGKKNSEEYNDIETNHSEYGPETFFSYIEKVEDLFDVFCTYLLDHLLIGSDILTDPRDSITLTDFFNNIGIFKGQVLSEISNPSGYFQSQLEQGYPLKVFYPPQWKVATFNPNLGAEISRYYYEFKEKLASLIYKQVANESEK
ncbi:hypothetical protein KC669_01275 [Candidatus Dojkabacteria bacterium]|uniref:Uncharacterized protein n=1 Tax=Candidatus Dojkabacteria bacterium TaxID=2099670 RepID=A0A955L9N4_9BACT|nr:hypothetical protein [Candidatus Dojkabacteria bacterium]